jgi:hypothetical protein
LQLQDYDIEIRRIKGSENVLANTISRNPGGFSEDDIKMLTKPREMNVMTINLGIDKSIKRDLNNIPTLQDNDPKLKSIKLATLQAPGQHF